MCSELFQESGRMLPQSLALTTLVCMEMLKALSAVSVDNSLLRVGPQSNTWLLLGVVARSEPEFWFWNGTAIALSMDDWKNVLDDWKTS
jgi:hypothetical protein